MTLKKQIEADITEARRKFKKAVESNDILLVNALSMYIDVLTKTLHELKEHYRSLTQ